MRVDGDPFVAVSTPLADGESFVRVTYNPFVDPGFVVERDGERVVVTRSSSAVFSTYRGTDGRDHGVVAAASAE